MEFLWLRLGGRSRVAVEPSCLLVCDQFLGYSFGYSWRGYRVNLAAGSMMVDDVLTSDLLLYSASVVKLVVVRFVLPGRI